jgi:nonsense-mediated mRNA decay protein 3
LQDLEEDEELRQNINLYKTDKATATAETEDEDAMDDDISEDEAPQIDIDELLDELDEMNLDG